MWLLWNPPAPEAAIELVAPVAAENVGQAPADPEVPEAVAAAVPEAEAPPGPAEAHPVPEAPVPQVEAPPIPEVEAPPVPDEPRRPLPNVDLRAFCQCPNVADEEHWPMVKMNCIHSWHRNCLQEWMDSGDLAFEHACPMRCHLG